MLQHLNCMVRQKVGGREGKRERGVRERGREREGEGGGGRVMDRSNINERKNNKESLDKVSAEWMKICFKCIKNCSYAQIAR